MPRGRSEHDATSIGRPRGPALGTLAPVRHRDGSAAVHLAHPDFERGHEAGRVGDQASVGRQSRLDLEAGVSGKRDSSAEPELRLIATTEQQCSSEPGEQHATQSRRDERALPAAAPRCGPPRGPRSGDQRLQLREHLLGTLPPVCRPPLQCAHDQVRELVRYSGALRPEVRWCLGHLRRDDRLRRISGERPPPGEQLVGDDTERIQVSAAVDFLVRYRLLRRHVARRPQRHACRRDEGRLCGCGHGLGHAEVEQQRVPPREHDVVGFDVAVDDALAVGIG